MYRLILSLLLLLSLCLLCAGQVWAATYLYQTIDPPASWNAPHLFVRGINDGNSTGPSLVGVTIEANGSERSWRYAPTISPALMRWNIPSGKSPKLWDINNRGQMVLTITTTDGEEFPALCQPSPCAQLPLPAWSGTPHLSNSGLVPGYFDDALMLIGFVFDTVTRKTVTVQVPDATETLLVGLTDDALYVGDSNASTALSSFVGVDQQQFPFQYPGAIFTHPLSVNNRADIVGLGLFETDIVSFVFLTVEQAFTTIDVPGSLSTLVSDVNNRGVVAGSYLNEAGLWRGFLAWPQAPAAATAAESSFAVRDERLRDEVKRRVDIVEVCGGLMRQYGARLATRAGCPPMAASNAR